MANNPKKMQDPTEAALSAIQVALEVRVKEAAAESGQTATAPAFTPPAEPEAPVPPVPGFEPSVRRRNRDRNGERQRPAVAAEDEELFGEQGAWPTPRSEDAVARRPAANDDRESIGQILQAVQRRPSRMSYTVATIFAVAWIVAGIGIGWLYLPQLEAMLSQAGSIAVPLIF